jgi:hypothetical protein
MSLRLEEFSDRDNEGAITSGELAESMGLRPTKALPHPERNIASRLAWLRRYGVVARTEDKRWMLNDVGERLLHASLKKGEQKVLDGFDEDELLVVVASLGDRIASAHDEHATMAVRQWRHNLAQRGKR